MHDLIQVSVDKSHITTIGEKLYGESLELIRELVSNSYDADAARVFIDLKTDLIKVRDDGTGMDEAGLREYFNIGSQNKKFAAVTQKYRRMKIGQFGIGKFAVLVGCDRFRLFTQKDGYASEVVFDKKEWQESDRWSVPIRTIPYDSMTGNGVTIILENLKRVFSIPEVERFVREKLPINAPHFEIYLNGKRVEPIYVAGKHFPISIKTGFGLIQGEIIAPNFKNKIPDKNVGIECTVNGVVIKREIFDMEIGATLLIHKMIGRVSADFLPITSDRSRFVFDSLEFQEFSAVMTKEIRKIVRMLNEDAALKSKHKTDETLKDTMSRLGKAIRKNPALSPKVMSPTGEIDSLADNPNSLAPESEGDSGGDDLEALKIDFGGGDKGKNGGDSDEFDEAYNKDRVAKAKKVKIKNLTGKMMVARRIKIGGLGIVCSIDGFGKEEKPIFTEGGVIYINQDHPLYKKQAKKGRDNLTFYLAYLLSQQIALLATETDPYRAFEIQNKLLADTF